MHDLPTKVIISAEAGSVFDLASRAIGEGLQRKIGRALTLENVGNSSGVGGAEAGAKAARDGTVLLVCNKGAITSHPHTAKTYQLTDFSPLCQFAEAPIAVAVGRNSPFRTLAELFDAAKAAPDTISYSTPNAYHTQRLAMAGFSERNGLKFKFLVIPGGNAESIKQLNDGTVHFAFLAAHNLVKSAAAGDIRVLGIAHGERLPFFKSIPTFKEQGYDLTTAIWLGLFAPAGLPTDRLSALQRLAEQAATDQITGKEIEGLQMVHAFLDHGKFSEKVLTDSTFHLGVLRALGAV
jgi:tripartite-type tricarboxylate transporter receptor subunit TctC